MYFTVTNNGEPIAEFAVHTSLREAYVTQILRDSMGRWDSNIISNVAKAVVYLGNEGAAVSCKLDCGLEVHKSLVKPPNPSIIVDFINPPIPVRQYDFVAYYDGYEPGDARGYGATADEARADLIAASSD